MTHRLTTEDVVNRIAEKPSPKFLVLLIGVMSIQVMKAMVAYFPNFGGYLPYNEWRCEIGSGDCYNRIHVFTSSNLQAWPEKDLFLDDRCLVNISAMDVNGATLRLLTDTKEEVGVVRVTGSSEGLSVELSSSNSTCDKNKDTCKVTGTIVGLTLSDRVSCTLQFKGTQTTDKEDTTRFSCDQKELEFTKEVFGFAEAVKTVKGLSGQGIGQYQLNCPDPKQYNKENLCGTNSAKELVLEKDFHWHTKGRSSFSIDWNLHCDREYLKSLIGSIFFAGALFGTFFGGNLYDLIGRKLGALVGYTMATASTLVASFSPSIEFLFVCRFLQGAGAYIGSTGGFVLILEYTASKYRVHSNIVIQTVFALGYLLNTFVAYFIKDWHWILAVDGILLAGSIIPLVLIPDSPRYFLTNKRDEKRAKKSLQWLAGINGSDFNVDSVTLTDLELIDQEEDAPNPSFMETMRDFLKYRELLIQLLIQMWLWLVAGFLYYGFSFSWSELGDNIYVSYIFAAIGEILAYIGMGFPIRYLGRTLSLMSFYLLASATFLIALIPLNFSSTFTLEQLSCLLGSMFVSAAFCAIYLFSAELAPTSHRGKMMGYCSSAARIGSFCGPQASLLFSWNKTITLILFAVLAASAGCLCYRLPDTKGVRIPSTAAEVQQRKDRTDNVTIENKYTS